MELPEVVTELKKNKAVETIIQFGSSLERTDYRDIDLCIFTTRDLSFQEKLVIRRDIPEKYDLTFYDDLPTHIKKEVLSQGKILFTKDYYKVLKELQYIDLEYPPYLAFLEEYHQARIASLS